VFSGLRAEFYRTPPAILLYLGILLAKLKLCCFFLPAAMVRIPEIEPDFYKAAAAA